MLLSFLFKCIGFGVKYHIIHSWWWKNILWWLKIKSHKALVLWFLGPIFRFLLFIIFLCSFAELKVAVRSTLEWSNRPVVLASRWRVMAAAAAAAATSTTSPSPVPSVPLPKRRHPQIPPWMTLREVLTGRMSHFIRINSAFPLLLSSLIFVFQGFMFHNFLALFLCLHV